MLGSGWMNALGALLSKMRKIEKEKENDILWEKNHKKKLTFDLYNDLLPLFDYVALKIK